jgi:membrane protein implicated in regulation of membrane protease activity
VNRFLQLTIAITTGIARDQSQRRRVMFALTLAALAMLFLGTFLLWSTFAAHPLFFAIYWLACVWLVICVLLLAIYDLLQVIRHGREEHAAARRKIFKDID